MRKLHLFLVSSIVIVSSLLTSCNKDEDPSGPVITFTNGIEETTINSGESWTITGNITSASGLDEVRYFQVVGNTETQLGATVSSFTDKNDFDFSVNIANITETMSFKVTAVDKNDITNSKSYIITVNAPTLTSYTDKILGAQSSANGSSFLSVDGTVLSIADAKANSSKVDFMYYYSASDNSAIVAPSDASASTQFNNATNGVATWTVRNATKLQKLTGVNFDTINTAADITDASTSGSSKVSSLAVGDVVAFKTASTSAHASKKGIFKVTAISAASTSGSITIQVKVEI